MKHLFLTLSLLLVITGISYAQPQVMDAFPESHIYAYDYQVAQITDRNGAPAIAFKDALINLISNYPTFKQVVHFTPGRKFFVITQLDPTQANATIYQVTFQKMMFGRPVNVFSAQYNQDQNTLASYDPQSRSYVVLPVAGDDIGFVAQAAAQFNIPPGGAPQPQAAAVDNSGPAPAPDDAAITTTQAPPPLQDEVQPECPTEGYLWQPGNWAWDASVGQYVWVPGQWAAPTQVGYLWTPSYWAFENGVYLWHVGYWGNTVGFYGGLNFGYGFWGDGFVGGRWEGGHFMYNTAVMRVNVNIHTTFVDRSRVFVGVRNRAAFNGRGGVVKEPTPAQMDERKKQESIAKANPAVNSQPGGRKPPVGTGKPPVGTGKPPVGTGKPPVGTGKPPVGTGKPPVGTGKPPVGTGKGPIKPPKITPPKKKSN